MRIRSLFGAVLLLGSSAVLLAQAPPRSDAELASWVAKRIADWQPTKDERRFDDIAWVANLREALKLAKEHQRPVFLFTHDGHMAIGRC